MADSTGATMVSTARASSKVDREAKYEQVVKGCCPSGADAAVLMMAVAQPSAGRASGGRAGSVRCPAFLLRDIELRREVTDFQANLQNGSAKTVTCD